MRQAVSRGVEWGGKEKDMVFGGLRSSEKEVRVWRCVISFPVGDEIRS